MSYEHTQRGPLYLILVAVAMILVAGSLVAPEPVHYLLLGVAVVNVIIGAMFRTLTVRGGDEALEIRFGPVPVFRKTIPYSDVTEVRTGRSRLIDGWGVHYIPTRGWTWNLWGFDCVELALGAQRLRIGTDDPEGLAAFLATKIDSAPPR